MYSHETQADVAPELYSFLLYYDKIDQMVAFNVCFVFLYCSGPVPVMVMSVLFIASVFLLHIWGKYSR